MGNQKITTESVDVLIDKEGILRVHIHEGTELDLDKVKELFKKYNELGMGPGKEKRLELMTGMGWHTMNREARDFVAFHGKDYFIAAAIINDTLAVRILVNFYNTFYRNEVPFRLFATEEKALEWLRKFKKSDA